MIRIWYTPDSSRTTSSKTMDVATRFVLLNINDQGAPASNMRVRHGGDLMKIAYGETPAKIRRGAIIL